MGWSDLEKKRDYERRYNTEHREAMNAYRREWHRKQMETNPEYREGKRASARKHNKLRASDPAFQEFKRSAEMSRHYAKKYGLTWDQIQEMVERQNGRCLICQMDVVDDPCVDHDHSTGEVRGILCRLCNTGLGMFRDNPTYCEAARVYLSQKGEQNQ